MTKLLLPASIILALAACSGTETDRTQSGEIDTALAPASAPETAPAASTSVPAVTDPQIAAIVVAANNVDIEASKLAGSKASDAKVKSFARQMVTDHSAVNKAATVLVTKLGVTPEENATSRQLIEAGTQNRKTLEGKSGKDFDQAYIDNEVSYHQTVLDALDNTLIPNAQNAEVKALLVQTRPAFVAHHKLAQDIQSSLKR